MGVNGGIFSEFWGQLYLKKKKKKKKNCVDLKILKLKAYVINAQNMSYLFYHLLPLI